MRFKSNFEGYFKNRKNVIYYNPWDLSFYNGKKGRPKSIFTRFYPFLMEEPLSISESWNAKNKERYFTKSGFGGPSYFVGECFKFNNIDFTPKKYVIYNNYGRFGKRALYMSFDTVSFMDNNNIFYNYLNRQLGESVYSVINYSRDRDTKRGVNPHNVYP